MSILIRFEKKEILFSHYKEKELSPLKVSASNLDIQSIKLPHTTEYNYYKTKIMGGTEVYIESENVDILLKIIEKYEYTMRPIVQKELVRQLRKHEERMAFGEKWYFKLWRASLMDLFSIWFTLRKERNAIPRPKGLK